MILKKHGERQRVLLLVCAALLSTALPARAKCGLGQHPAYDDITAVRYVRTPCRGKCPVYEVLFSGFGLYFVGRSDVNRHGTYVAELPGRLDYPEWNPDGLRLAVRVLQKHDFFSLSVRASIVTDVPHLIVAVDRCRVSTKLDLATYGQRPDIDRLFDDLDDVTDKVRWRKQNDSLLSPIPFVAPIPQ